MDGGCRAKFFGTKMALAPALGEPCAFLARPQSRLSFWSNILSCHALMLVFVCFPSVYYRYPSTFN